MGNRAVLGSPSLLGEECDLDSMHADLPDVLARVLLQRPAEITPGAAPESPAAMRGWGPAISLRRRRRRLAKSLGGHGLRSFEMGVQTKSKTSTSSTSLPHAMPYILRSHFCEIQEVGGACFKVTSI